MKESVECWTHNICSWIVTTTTVAQSVDNSFVFDYHRGIIMEKATSSRDLDTWLVCPSGSVFPTTLAWFLPAWQPRRRGRLLSEASWGGFNRDMLWYASFVVCIRYHVPVSYYFFAKMFNRHFARNVMLWHAAIGACVSCANRRRCHVTFRRVSILYWPRGAGEYSAHRLSARRRFFYVGVRVVRFPFPMAGKNHN